MTIVPEPRQRRPSSSYLGGLVDVAHLISIMRRAQDVCLNAWHDAYKMGKFTAQSGIISDLPNANPLITKGLCLRLQTGMGHALECAVRRGNVTNRKTREA